MNIELKKASESDHKIIKNLVPYYIYDMSEYMGWPCTPEGKFGGCDHLPLYWKEKGRFPFLIRVGEETAGFALVRGNHDENDIDYSIAEFFVLRKFRGKSVGENVAGQLFDSFRGRWKVGQLADNAPAIAFWRKIIGRYTKGAFQEKEENSPWGPMNEIFFNNKNSRTRNKF